MKILISRKEEARCDWRSHRRPKGQKKGLKKAGRWCRSLLVGRSLSPQPTEKQTASSAGVASASLGKQATPTPPLSAKPQQSNVNKFWNY